MAVNITNERSIDHAKHMATVEQFIDFTKHVADDMFGGVFWDTEMTRLYGDPLMARTMGCSWAQGVPGVKERLTRAFEQTGLTGLKTIFCEETVINTRVWNLGGGGKNVIFDRITKWKPKER